MKTVSKESFTRKEENSLREREILTWIKTLINLELVFICGRELSLTLPPVFLSHAVLAFFLKSIVLLFDIL